MTGGLGSLFKDAPASVARHHSSIGRRLDGLRTAVDAADGRLGAGLLDEVEATIARADGRIGLSHRHTVVAIAGSTGSGKSATFNALAGVPLSTSSAQRPTTAAAKALVWGESSPDVADLLVWLGVAPTDQFYRSTLPDAPPRSALPENLILLDLPDHDSLETSHHREAERVIQLADVMIWVVDPQKYADAAIHERFLRPLAGHRGVTIVVMNQIDTVAEDERRGLLRDLRKVLVADGLRDPRVLGVSARQGLGIDELRAALHRRVDDATQADQRTGADVAAAAESLAAAAGDAPRSVPDVWVDDVVRRVGEAAGVPGAVERVHTASSSARAEVRIGPVDGSAVSAAARSFADQAARDLTSAWGAPLRSAVTAQVPTLVDRLDAELGAIRPDARSDARGRRFVAPLIGALIALAGASYLMTTGRTAPALVATVAALLVGVGGMAAAQAAARRSAHQAALAVADACDSAIGRVVRAHVVDPAQAELASYQRFRAGLDAARAMPAGGRASN